MSMFYNDDLPWCYGLRYKDIADDVFKITFDKISVLWFILNGCRTNWR